MKHLVLVVALCAAAAPAPASAQEADVTRRSWVFLGNHLEVAVRADAPGTLHVIRGEPGRVEAAARTREGFAGFGMSANPLHELSLSAVGAQAVQYLVVVPAQVAVRIRLPAGNAASPPLNGTSATYSWGAAAATAEPPLQATLANGLFLIHATQFAPAAVVLPDLAAVRSVSVRVEGGSFRIASSQPLPVDLARTGLVQLGAAASATDIVIYVPRSGTPFYVQSGGRRLVDVVAGRPRSTCSGAVLVAPTPEQAWLTLHGSAVGSGCR